MLRSLERSLVEGHHVVLTNVCLPFHPSILPVIQAGLYWHNVDQRKIIIHVTFVHNTDMYV